MLYGSLPLPASPIGDRLRGRSWNAARPTRPSLQLAAPATAAAWTRRDVQRIASRGGASNVLLEGRGRTRRYLWRGSWWSVARGGIGAVVIIRRRSPQTPPLVGRAHHCGNVLPSCRRCAAGGGLATSCLKTAEVVVEGVHHLRAPPTALRAVHGG